DRLGSYDISALVMNDNAADGSVGDKRRVGIDNYSRVVDLTVFPAESGHIFGRDNVAAFAPGARHGGEDITPSHDGFFDVERLGGFGELGRDGDSFRGGGFALDSGHDGNRVSA